MARPGILVVAKAPVAGVAKTRLGATVGHRQAADLAAAALLDTLDACEEAFPARRRVLALDGDLERAARSSEITQRMRGWTVLPQRGADFGQRLAAAHQDAAALLCGPVLQVGTDTPQLQPGQLGRLAERLLERGNDAVLAPALDGGWWALGAGDPRWAGGLVDVPMSTAQTCAATQQMLAGYGARVAGGPALRDVDDEADAAAVSRAAPWTRFAAAWGTSVGRAPAAELFDAALSGSPCVLHGMPAGPVVLPVSRWSSGCDDADTALLDGCSGATLDIGCGPGRLTHALSLRGLAALGIDIAPRAVSQTRKRGAQALRRDVFDRLPAEGRWESVLLADGNIGIGGDPLRLLRRVHDLLAPAGRALVEVAPAGTAATAHQVHLEVGGRLSHPFPWAVVGPEALCRLAEQAAMRMLRVTAVDGRCFVELAKVRG